MPATATVTITGTASDSGLADRALTVANMTADDYEPAVMPHG